MRAQARQASHEEEEESAFVSMTDMTVGFLFIIMILLAFFASQIRDADAVSRDSYLEMVAERDHWKEMALSRAEQIQKLEEELQKLTQQHDDLLAQAAQLERQLERARRELAQQTLRVAELETILAALRTQISEKDEEIDALKAELADLKQIDPLEEYLARVAGTRREVLQKLRDAIMLDFPDLRVELSEESDALRFQGEGLFASGRSQLSRDKRKIVARLAQRLDEILPCFTIGKSTRFSVECNPGFVMIEAVQIEGHTDNVGSDSLNRNLSAARANSTFFAMTEAAPSVMVHQNLKGQPVLSVAAYGPDRPVVTNETIQGRATNRRIDLRFIMVTPRDTDGIATIRMALDSIVTEAE